MKKQDMIYTLNARDNYKELGFEIVADDGRNQLLRRKWGRGFMFINRFEDWVDNREDEDMAIYTADISGWDSGR